MGTPSSPRGRKGHREKSLSPGEYASMDTDERRYAGNPAGLATSTDCCIGPQGQSRPRPPQQPDRAAGTQVPDIDPRVCAIETNGSTTGMYVGALETNVWMAQMYV